MQDVVCPENGILVVERNGLASHETKSVIPKCTLLSESSQPWKATHSMIPTT